MSYLTVYGENFPVMISDTFTGEDVEAKVKFTFYKGYQACCDTPSEPPEVIVEVVAVDGIDVTNKLSHNEFRHIESIILEEMLQNHYNDA